MIPFTIYCGGDHITIDCPLPYKATDVARNPVYDGFAPHVSRWLREMVKPQCEKRWGHGMFARRGQGWNEIMGFTLDWTMEQRI